MKMQKLRKPPHSRILSSLQTLFLFRIALIAPRGKSVLQAGKVLVVVFDVQGGDHAVRVGFQLGG